jgi:hypothetical protein
MKQVFTGQKHSTENVLVICVHYSHCIYNGEMLLIFHVTAILSSMVHAYIDFQCGPTHINIIYHFLVFGISFIRIIYFSSNA